MIQDMVYSKMMTYPIWGRAERLGIDTLGSFCYSVLIRKDKSEALLTQCPALEKGNSAAAKKPWSHNLGRC